MPTSNEQKEAKRREKAAEKQRAEEVARAERKAALREVESFHKTIKDITSSHQAIRANIDWTYARFSLRPHPPIKVAWACVKEIAGPHMSSIFPSGNIVNSKVAEDKDDQENARNERLHGDEVENWRTMKEIGIKLKEGGPEAVMEAWSEVVKRGMVSGVGTEASIKVCDKDRIHAEVIIEGREIIPSEVKSLTSTGKLSTKPMPKGRAAEIYEDYVCGRCLSVAGALFAALPVEEVIVNAVTTGGQEDRRFPVVSVHFTREGFSTLKTDGLDPSDALQSFRHTGSVRGSKRGLDFVEIKPLGFPDRDKPSCNKGSGIDGVLEYGRGLLAKLSKRVGNGVGETETSSL